MRWEDLKSLLVLLVTFSYTLPFFSENKSILFGHMTYFPPHLSSITNPAATSQGPPRSVRFPLNFPLQNSCIIYDWCHTIKQLLVHYGIMEPSSLMMVAMQGIPGTRDFMLPFHFPSIVISLRARTVNGAFDPSQMLPLFITHIQGLLVVGLVLTYLHF